MLTFCDCATPRRRKHVNDVPQTGFEFVVAYFLSGLTRVVSAFRVIGEYLLPYSTLPSVAQPPQCRIRRVITEEWIRNAVKGRCGDAIWATVLIFTLRGLLRCGKISRRTRCRGQGSNPSMKGEHIRLDGVVQRTFYSSEPWRYNFYIMRYSLNVF